MKTYNKDEVERLKFLRASGKPYAEIAKELCRTLDSIEQKCIRLMKTDKTLISRNTPKDTKIYDLCSDLSTVGLMLWWAEGTKGGKSVQFVNSSPDIIRLYVLFLREIGVDWSRVKAKVKVMNLSQIKDCQEYWSILSGIPIENFTKPIVRGKEVIETGHKGCLTITYSSVNLKKRMEARIIEIRDQFLA
jgi:hypothetical protein